MTHQYWFARRYPVGNPRQAMAPVHWKGWLMTLFFVLVLTFGGGLFVWFGMQEQFAQGVLLFGLIGFVATAWFTLLIRANGDKVHTVEDYKKGRVRV